MAAVPEVQQGHSVGTLIASLENMYQWKQCSRCGQEWASSFVIVD